MNKHLVAFGSILLITCTPFVFAASSQDLTVRGVITPSACDTQITGGGVVDFGKMSAKELNAEQYTPLPRQTVQLSVSCEGPTLFTLNTIDNRPGSSANHPHWHGLGMTAEGEKIGGAGFNLYNPLADNLPAQTINSSDGGTTWQLGTQLNPTVLTAVAINNVPVPVAVRQFHANLRLNTHIAPSDNLTLLDEVPVDGHATVQLMYL